jgi:hypothetical protein
MCGSRSRYAAASSAGATVPVDWPDSPAATGSLLRRRPLCIKCMCTRFGSHMFPRLLPADGHHPVLVVMYQHLKCQVVRSTALLCTLAHMNVPPTAVKPGVGPTTTARDFADPTVRVQEQSLSPLL